MKSNHAGVSRAELYQNIGITATVNDLPIQIDVTNGFTVQRPIAAAEARRLVAMTSRRLPTDSRANVESPGKRERPQPATVGGKKGSGAVGAARGGRGARSMSPRGRRHDICVLTTSRERPIFTGVARGKVTYTRERKFTRENAHCPMYSGNSAGAPELTEGSDTRSSNLLVTKHGSSGSLRGASGWAKSSGGSLSI